MELKSKNTKSELEIVEYNELMLKKTELKNKLKQEEKHRQYLTQRLSELEAQLINVKKRYRREQNLQKAQKKQLQELTRSRSWKLSLPIRKIGKLFKKSSPNNTSKSTTNNGMLRDYSYARGLERKMWAGYSTHAFNDLKQLIDSSSAPLNERLRALRSIARWYYDKQEYEKSYAALNYVNELKPLNHPSPDRIITEIKVMKKLNKINSAKKKVWSAIKARGIQSELCISMAYLAENELERLYWINMLYEMNGYCQIDLKDKNKSISLENIYSKGQKNAGELEKYKVSIIIPAYNAGDLIKIALDSLLEQTVKNLEIIVVDDCSTDNTANIVENYEKNDSRIKLVRKRTNEGAYAARNTGLRFATGDFITVHDSDDWSHPQKIETQLYQLLVNPTAVGSISYLFRATKDMVPINGGSLLSAKFLMMNSSSLLVRRTVFEKLGCWDFVRVAGDSEFIWRIEKVFGKDSIIRVKPNIPFSIALANESSLTGTSTTHVKTINFGLRRTYRESFEWWHRQAKSNEELYIDPSNNERYFPCPIPNMISQPETRNYDYVLLADFTSDTDQNYLLNLLMKIVNKRNNIAIFHWPDYNGNPFNAISDEVYEIVNKYGIDLLVPNEKIYSDKLLVLTPRILDYHFDFIPNIECENCYIVDEGEVSKEAKTKRENNLIKTLRKKIFCHWINKEKIEKI